MLKDFIKNQTQHAGAICGSIPRHNQYQQKAQVHKHKIHTCPFSCPLPSVDMNSAVHSYVTGRRQKDICGSTIDTATEMEFCERQPPSPPGFSTRAIMQLKYSQVQPGQYFHISFRKLGLFKCTIFVEKRASVGRSCACEERGC